MVKKIVDEIKLNILHDSEHIWWSWSWRRFPRKRPHASDATPVSPLTKWLTFVTIGCHSRRYTKNKRLISCQLNNCIKFIDLVNAFATSDSQATATKPFVYCSDDCHNPVNMIWHIMFRLVDCPIKIILYLQRGNSLPEWRHFICKCHILVKNIIAQQIIRKRGIYWATFRHITSDIIGLNTVKLFIYFITYFEKIYDIQTVKKLKLERHNVRLLTLF